MSQTGLEVAGMSEEQMRNEKMYLATMNMAKDLLTNGIITEEEYHEIDVMGRNNFLEWRKLSQPPIALIKCRPHILDFSSGYAIGLGKFFPVIADYDEDVRGHGASFCFTYVKMAGGFDG